MKKKLESLFQNNEFQLIVKFVLGGVSIIGPILPKFVPEFIAKNNVWAYILALCIVFVIFLVLIFISELLDANFDIYKIIANYHKNKKFSSVVRLAYPLSRPLWLVGKYKLRIKMGRQIFSALNSLKDDTIFIDDKNINVEELKARVLIDDLGWTIFRTDPNSKESIAHIERGISIANEEHLCSLAIKGHRHLIGIYDKLRDEKKMMEHVDKANAILLNNNILNEEREHIQKGLDYALLTVEVNSYRRENKNDTAELNEYITKINNLSNYYKAKEDWERYAKTFYIKAEILMLYDSPVKYIEAKSVLEKGLVMCETQARLDGFIRISIMLMRILNKDIIIQNDKEERARLIKEFRNYYSDAMKRAEEIDNKEHISVLNELKRKMGRIG